MQYCGCERNLKLRRVFKKFACMDVQARHGANENDRLIDPTNGNERSTRRLRGNESLVLCLLSEYCSMCCTDDVQDLSLT